MTVAADTSGHGNAKGNLEYSSMTVRIYLFLDEDGRGPLKSMLNLSNGWVALIRFSVGGLANRGLVSAHEGQFFVIPFTSSTEKGRFLDLTKW